MVKNAWGVVKIPGGVVKIPGMCDYCPRCNSRKVGTYGTGLSIVSWQGLIWGGGTWDFPLTLPP